MDYPSASNNNSLKRKGSVTCFVPKCPSNSVRFPHKLFLTVPSEPKLREKWMKAARRHDAISPKSVIRCCEDHFDMENDIENWMKFKIFGGRLYLKKDVVPHFFDCQLRQRISKPRSLVLKRKRQEILQNIENEKVKKSRDQSIQVESYQYNQSKEVQETSSLQVYNFIYSDSDNESSVDVETNTETEGETRSMSGSDTNDLHSETESWHSNLVEKLIQ